MTHYFVSIKGAKQGQFKGDQPDLTGREDWIAGIRFTMELSLPVDEATGHPSGKRRFKPVHITKRWGAASPQILQALATDEVLNPVVLEFTRTSPEGKEVVYQRITLTNAIVIDVQRSLDFNGPDLMEVEEIEITFQKIRFEDVASGTVYADDWIGSARRGKL